MMTPGPTKILRADTLPESLMMDKLTVRQERAVSAL